MRLTSVWYLLLLFDLPYSSLIFCIKFLSVYQLWDTAGQERFKSLRTPFYRGTDICMLSYAINDKTSFDNLTMWRDEFLLYSGIKDSKQFPFLVVGSKVSVIFQTYFYQYLCCKMPGQILKVYGFCNWLKIQILYFIVKPLIH